MSFVLSIALSSWVASAAIDPGLTVTDPFYVETALHYADKAALDELAHSSFEDVRRLAAAAALRLDGRLTESDASAEACYAWAVSRKHFMTATRCLTVEAGNSLLRGDEREAMGGFARFRDVFEQQVAPGIPGGAHYRSAEFMPKSSVPKSFPDDEPAGPVPSGAIEFQWRGDVPTLPVTINGQKFTAVFDTGSAMSAISDDVADQLGLRSDGQWFGTLVDGAIQYSSRYVVNFGIPGVSMGRRSLVGIRTPGQILIGRDLMRRLGTFEVSRRGISILDAENQDAAHCEEPLSEGSNLDGTSGGIYIPIIANGLSVRAFLDTGYTTFLSQFVGPSVPPDSDHEWARQTVMLAETTETTYTRTVGGFLSFGKDAWVQTKTRMETSSRFQPGQVVLGSMSLRDVRYLIDFRRHHLCTISSSTASYTSHEN